MPRHDPGVPPRAEPGHAGRRLSAAIGSGPGLLAGPPMVTLPEGQWEPGPDDSPPQSRVRWRTGRRVAALLCLVAAVCLGWFWWQAANGTSQVSPLGSVTAAESGEVPAPAPQTAPATAPGPATEKSPGASGGDRGGNIIVHVAGAVVRAGIVELPQGSRLHEAIAAAGGSAPGADPDQLNLAAVLEDGQKVLVPRQGETVPAGPGAPAAGTGYPGSPTGGGGGSVPAAGKINLNTAGADELATLPRVGPVLAQRIVEWRTQHGRFQRVEELDAVDGIGPQLLAAVLPLVRV